MFSHVMVGSDDIARSKKFYDAVFGAMGGKPAVPGCQGPADLCAQRRRVHGEPAHRWQPATHANGGTIGFTMANPEQAVAWHEAEWRTAAAIEEPPGVRPGGAAMYLAYLRDPDGNKLCALHRMPAA